MQGGSCGERKGSAKSTGLMQPEEERNKTGGLVHLYCGDGKGKTTAAIGLAVRAAGAGKRVIFSQFMKGSETSELEVLQKIPGIEVRRLRKNYGFYRNMTDKDKEAVRQEHNRILQYSKEKIIEGQCDVLVMDEVVYAYGLHLAERKWIEEILETSCGVEIVLTGREPERYLVEQADYITEMRKIRHPYDKGIKARAGIEM